MEEKTQKTRIATLCFGIMTGMHKTLPMDICFEYTDGWRIG